jgi:polysaccharide pyruvyl transferase WcaK-like protein
MTAKTSGRPSDAQVNPSTSEHQRQRKVAICGTFDVRNFGDLLFPLIAQHQLHRHGIAVEALSPWGRDTGWEDCAPVRPIARFLKRDDRCDGVLIGGGNIIHADPVTLPDYVAAGIADRAYSSLWLGASVAAVAQGIPVAWNAPGVPHAFDESDMPGLRAVLGAADYLSVRDAASAAFLPGVKPEVVPDTALALADLWPRETLASHFRALQERVVAGPESRFLAVHVKARSVRGTISELAGKLCRFARNHDCIPIVIGIGACHGDDVVADAVCAAMDVTHINLARPSGLREIAAAIAFADAYVGASMHGYVTAASYGRPGVIVGRPKLVKVSGLLQHLGRRGDEASDWDEALGKTALRLAADRPGLPDCVRTALDVHWARVAAALSSPPANSEGRQMLLHAATTGSFTTDPLFPLSV